MKKFLLSILVSGIFAGTASAQQWLISPNDLKGNTGRLILDYPGTTDWQVNIWTMAGDKFVTTIKNSNKKTAHVLTPGEYRVKLNTVELLHVPIQKGHDTKLVWGILNIVSQTDWRLDDETGKQHFISGKKPVKMAVPVGTYSIKLGGSAQKVVVKNGETVEL